MAKARSFMTLRDSKDHVVKNIEPEVKAEGSGQLALQLRKLSQG